MPTERSLISRFPRKAATVVATGSLCASTPPPMHQQEPALKAGFLLPGIPCWRGISRGLARAAGYFRAPDFGHGSIPFSSLFSSVVRELRFRGTSRTISATKTFPVPAKAARGPSRSSNRQQNQRNGLLARHLDAAAGLTAMRPANQGEFDCDRLLGTVTSGPPVRALPPTAHLLRPSCTGSYSCG